MQDFKPPLAIHFIWHQADNTKVESILDLVRVSFARDVDRPFSRGLNIPLFFYSSGTDNCQELNAPREYGERDVVFIFTSVHTMGNSQWESYIKRLPSSTDSFKLVPIAVDRYGLGHSNEGALSCINFLRSYQWDKEHYEQMALLHMAHEIYRYGLKNITEGDVGKNSSINIFLSHSKTDCVGLSIAEEIRKHIDTTNMNRFFDATEISPGFLFGQEIVEHIKQSTLLLIGSDSYSSRYWCQREMLCAKEYERPILSVDCLEEFEDRVFPAGSNIPSIHVPADGPISKSDVLRILIATILETIRHFHAEKSLKFYRNKKWIDVDCKILSRPPEIRQIIECQKKGISKVCYPEPSLYSEETDWVSHLKIQAFTPLWNSDEDKILKDLRIGVSLSECDWGAYTQFHLHPNHLKRLSQDIARHLLARSAVIVYCGDLRNDGFTEFIMDEAIALKSRLNNAHLHVENYLAWPNYVPEASKLVWIAKYSQVMDFILCKIPKDVEGCVEETQFLEPSGVRNRFIWSRCLTEMREESISTSDVRICAGGKLSEYTGKMPGVLEEILIALKQDKPIFLLGAFGGVVGEVCKTLQKGKITVPLTEAWQADQNPEYKGVQEYAAKSKQDANYDHIKKVLEGISLEALAQRCGMNKKDYLRLMNSPFVDECVYLILTGLKALRSSRKDK